MSRGRTLFGLQADPIVFAFSAVLIFGFVVFGAVSPELAESVFGDVQTAITDHLGWFYSLVVSFFVGFALWLAFGRFGRIRLGNDAARPHYSYAAWFAMLFSAGMGIGVLFWSVAEPITHFSNSPTAESGTEAAAREAINWTFLHWGIHGWGVYVIVGLTLAYMTYRRGMPLALRSVFYPVLGSRVDGPIGRTIDIFAVLGTMFGVATTLGLGAQQVMAGLEHVYGVPATTSTEVWLIVGITAMATVSVVSGLDRGIRRLSQTAIVLAIVLLFFILFAGPTATLLGLFVENIGYYIRELPRAATWSATYQGGDWHANWTLFYWGWWLAWSPFVGVFIARISYGRTVREFVLGVMLVPTLVTFFWYSVFGNSALQRALDGNDAVVNASQDNFPVAIFVFFESYPLTTLLSVVGVAVIVLFFVTSSDSASLVIDMLTSGGNLDPPTWQRVFWATSEGAVAAVLLLTGGLAGMRAFQITTGLPLAVILLAMCYFLVRALGTDDEREQERLIVPTGPEGASQDGPKQDTSDLWVPDEERAHSAERE